MVSCSEFLESTQEGSANDDLIVIEPDNNVATQIDRSVSSNNLTLTSSMSGGPVQPKRTCGIRNSKSESRASNGT